MNNKQNPHAFEEIEVQQISLVGQFNAVNVLRVLFTDM